MDTKILMAGLAISLFMGASKPQIIITKPVIKYATHIVENDALYTLPSERPYPQTAVSSGFNPRRMHPVLRRIRPHKGIDIGQPYGTPIEASANGKIVKVGYSSHGYGWHIVISHGLNEEEQIITSLYAHLANRPCVELGEMVKKGQIIGNVGSTGTSTSPHLHFEVRVDNKAVNPIKYFN